MFSQSFFAKGIIQAENKHLVHTRIWTKNVLIRDQRRSLENGYRYSACQLEQKKRLLNSRRKRDKSVQSNKKCVAWKKIFTVKKKIWNRNKSLRPPRDRRCDVTKILDRDWFTIQILNSRSFPFSLFRHHTRPNSHVSIHEMLEASIQLFNSYGRTRVGNFNRVWCNQGKILVKAKIQRFSRKTGKITTFSRECVNRQGRLSRASHCFGQDKNGQ